jgi:hypothetical protein
MGNMQLTIVHTSNPAEYYLQSVTTISSSLEATLLIGAGVSSGGYTTSIEALSLGSNNSGFNIDPFNQAVESPICFLDQEGSPTVCGKCK